MNKQIKKTLLITLALSIAAFFAISYFASSFSNSGIEITHINHFN